MLKKPPYLRGSVWFLRPSVILSDIHYPSTSTPLCLTMVKNNDINIQKRKPKSSGGTPRRGDCTKLRRTRFVEELDDTEDRPLDLEPDGKPRERRQRLRTQHCQT
jgi:hypothetical protein